MNYVFARRETAASSDVGSRSLSPASQRALAEADARRRARDGAAYPWPKEFNGPKGPEPTRYGDWESRGIAHDF
jgi:hypothetical protein